MKQILLLLTTISLVLTFDVLEKIQVVEEDLVVKKESKSFKLRDFGEACTSHLLCSDGCCQNEVCVNKDECIAEVNNLLIIGCVICLVLFIFSFFFLFYQRRQTQKDVQIIKNKINEDRRILAEKTKAAIERNTAKI